MKKIQLLLIFTITLYSFSFSQTERIYVKAGSDQWENFMKVIYLYPSFKEGMVDFKDGKRFVRPMNYNKIAGTVEFISEKNDTMAFADEASILHVNIGDDIFTFNPLCMRFLSSKKVKLYVYEKMKIGDNQKIGAMGIPNSGSAIETVNKIESSQQTYNLNMNEVVILSKSTSYYIQTSTSEILPATKKNILNMFPENEDAVKQFIKTKNISFNKSEDLIELVKFLDDLN